MPAVATSPAATIDEVIARLDSIVEESLRERSRLGLFACLYRAVTRRVRDGIAGGRFEDGARMERFDVIFANRYLHAFEAYRRGEHPGVSWLLSFEGARSRRLLILQHLLLGMNAHINFDLGVAAAQAAPGSELAGMRKDFFEISRLLGEMMDDVQARINGLSPWMGLVDRVGCRNDEHVFFFGLSRARDTAWQVAECISATPRDRLAAELGRVDRAAGLCGRVIRTPGLERLPALLLVRSREPNDVTRVIEALA